MEENGNGINVELIFKILKIALYPIIGIIGFILGWLTPKAKAKLHEKRAEKLEKKAADEKLKAAKAKADETAEDKKSKK